MIEIKTIDRRVTRKTRVLVYCKACGLATRNEKLYCSNHIDRVEYIQKLTKRLAAIAAEKSGEGEPVLLAQEIYWELQTAATPLSMARLGQDLGINSKVMEKAVELLRGKVKRFAFKRGNDGLELV